MIRFRNPAVRLLAVVVSLTVLAIGVWRTAGPESIATSHPPSSPLPRSSTLPGAATDPGILAAIRDQRSKVWGQANGVVTRLLADDREGARHQRFLIRLEGGATLLVAYNLELAPRIAPINLGDTVLVRGEYIWNDKGGLMHWVHRDPSRRQPGGWVRIRGREYR